jgi:two-component system response regulator FixJ
MQNRPDVYIIDDDRAVRDALSFLLKSAGVTPHAYESATDFLDASDTLEPGCVITDVRMPEMDGLTLVRHIRDKGLRHPIVVITGHGDVPLAVEALKAGAVDFLEKPFKDTALLAAVTAALDGAQRAGLTDDAAPSKELLEALSPREQDVLRGVVAGKSNKVIALDLGISPRTVEVHRANLMTKTGAGSLSDLVRMAFQVGL